MCTTARSGACAGTTPVCGTDEVCRACTAHSECASDVCLPDGSCGDAAAVAFVDPTGASNTSCSLAMPCPQVAMALATNRAYVKIHGTVDEAVALASRNVTFLADPGAVLKKTGGTALAISGTSQVAIYDLTISQSATGISVPDTATGVSLSLTGVHVQNHANGGVVMNAGALAITRSTISNNTGAGGVSTVGTPVALTVSESTFAANSGGEGILLQAGSLVVSRSSFLNNINGGIHAGAFDASGAASSSVTFVIVGNTFFNNGRSDQHTGGVLLNTSTNATNRLDFNSFAQNQTMNGVAPAIQCTVAGFTARNNIMSGNTESGILAPDQFGGSCTHAYSIAAPGSLPAGSGNSTADPQFVAPATGNLHLATTSPARRAADPASDLNGVAARDIDGDLRVAPADMGADQVSP